MEYDTYYDSDDIVLTASISLITPKFRSESIISLSLLNTPALEAFSVVYQENTFYSDLSLSLNFGIKLKNIEVFGDTFYFLIGVFKVLCSRCSK